MNDKLERCQTFLKNQRSRTGFGGDCTPAAVIEQVAIKEQVAQCLGCEEKLDKIRGRGVISDETVHLALVRVRRAKEACEANIVKPNASPYPTTEGN